MPQRLEKMLDQYYKQIEKALDKACPKQMEIIINKNNPWRKRNSKATKIRKKNTKRTEQTQALKLDTTRHLSL